MTAPVDSASLRLIQLIDQALPQTQCTRCGYPDCHAYAQAIAQEGAPINQCPPGGTEGIERLATLTGRPALPLNEAHGTEGARLVAQIDEAWCIGCTLCIKACPADCIIGASKQMHVIVTDQCTGCELCVPACPVDCISLEEATPGLSGWAAWSPEQAQAARARYDFKRFRMTREHEENEERLRAKAEHKLAHLAELTKPGDETEMHRKRSILEAALARAKARAEGQS